MNLPTHEGGIIKKHKNSEYSLLTHQERDDICITSRIDAIHQAMRYWHAGKLDEMKKLLRESGNIGGEFNAVCRAIINAGNGETPEAVEMEHFLTGRQRETYTPETGTIPYYDESK